MKIKNLCLKNNFNYDDELNICYEKKSFEYKDNCKDHLSILNCKLESKCTWDFSKKKCFQYSNLKPNINDYESLENKFFLEDTVENTIKNVHKNCNNDKECVRIIMSKIKNDINNII